MNTAGQFPEVGQQIQNERSYAQLNHQLPDDSSVPNNFVNGDNEMLRLMQHRLVLMLHSCKCLRRERQQRLDGTEPIRECTLPTGYTVPVNLPPYCAAMKQVLLHMDNCSAGKECTVPNCSSTRLILNHWKKCRQTECLFCMPFVPLTEANVQMPKEPLLHAQYEQQLLQKAYRALGLPYKEQNYSQQSQQTHQSPKAWQAELNSDIREHLVQKIVLAAFPDFNSNLPSQDERIANLCTYAKGVESDMFEKANSLEEYYHLIEEKMDIIPKEFEEKSSKGVNSNFN